MKPKVVSIAADKGGTGKTTTAYILSSAFSWIGKKVLAIDLDPQANLTKVMTGKRGNDLEDTLPSALRQHKPMPIIHAYGNVDLLPSDITLATLEDDLQKSITDILQPVFLKAPYDIVVIDCPPGASSRLAYGAAALSDALIIPATPDDFSVDSVDNMLELIQGFKSLNVGVLVTMMRYNGGNIYKAYEQVIRERYSDMVYETSVRYTSRLLTKMAFQRPVYMPDISSYIPGISRKKHILDKKELTIAEEDYLKVAQECLKRINI